MKQPLILARHYHVITLYKTRMTSTYIINRFILIFIFIILLLWIGGAVLTPTMAILGDGGRHFIKGLYNLVCHQLPERSLHIDYLPIYLCVRCTAFYLSGIVLIALFMVKNSMRMLPLFFYALLILPAIFDFFLEKTGIYHDIVTLRFLTGFLLGLALFHLLILSVSQREDEFSLYQENAHG